MYKLVYFLPNQSKLFSEPRLYETYSIDEFTRVLEIAEKEGYEVVYSTSI